MITIYPFTNLSPGVARIESNVKRHNRFPVSWTTLINRLLKNSLFRVPKRTITWLLFCNNREIIRGWDVKRITRSLNFIVERFVIGNGIGNSFDHDFRPFFLSINQTQCASVLASINTPLLFKRIWTFRWSCNI